MAAASSLLHVTAHWPHVRVSISPTRIVAKAGGRQLVGIDYNDQSSEFHTDTV